MSSGQPDDSITELQAEIHGLRLVLSIALNLLPAELVAERLLRMEQNLRSQNALSGTIEVVRSFREIWEK